MLAMPGRGEVVVTVSPNPLAFSARSGESTSLPVQISNPTTGAVAWKLEFLDANGKTNSLESLLASIDASGTTLNGPLPSRYDFTEGETGTSISTGVPSGSSQIFNQGNKLTTNLGGPLAYSNGAVASSTILGTGGRYFTRKLPGLFIFAADLNEVSWFEVAGIFTYPSSRQTSEFTVPVMASNGVPSSPKPWITGAPSTISFWWIKAASPRLPEPLPLTRNTASPA